VPIGLLWCWQTNLSTPNTLVLVTDDALKYASLELVNGAPRMKILFRLISTLALLWILFSGLFKTQLIVLGLLSVLLVAWLAYRMRVLEHRGQPVYFGVFRLLGYWTWLCREIMRSNFAVVRMIIDPELPIRPMLRRIKATPDTEIGRVIYANSITLTPGTTAINFTPDGEILVHALHEDSLHELEEGKMAARVRSVEPHYPLLPTDAVPGSKLD